MKTLFKILYVCIAIVFVAFLTGIAVPREGVVYEKTAEDIVETHEEEAEETESVSIKWDKFIEAVIWKESRGNASCIGDNGKAVGVLQIHPIMVREANRILKMLGKEAEYTYEDRYDRNKSIEIFNIVQDFHNKTHDFERALQIWNKNHPESYKTQIMNKYNELVSL